jgi:hypothetical protein
MMPTRSHLLMFAAATLLVPLTLMTSTMSLAQPVTLKAAAPPATITFKQIDRRDHFVDVPPLGGPDRPPTMGDAFVSRNELIDPSTKHKVGTTHQMCVVTRVMHKPLNAWAVCSVVLDTARGQLTLQTAWSFTASEQALAVTGGTGDYAGATGTATWTSGRGNRSTWTVQIGP